MLDKLAAAARAHPGLKRWGKYVSATILIGIGKEDFLIVIENGDVVEVRPRRIAVESGVFAIRADKAVWDEHWRPHPKRGYHDLYHMFSYGHARIDGDLRLFMQNLLFFKLLLAAPRALNRAEGGQNG